MAEWTYGLISSSSSSLLRRCVFAVDLDLNPNFILTLGGSILALWYLWHCMPRKHSKELKRLHKTRACVLYVSRDGGPAGGGGGGGGGAGRQNPLRFSAGIANCAAFQIDPLKLYHESIIQHLAKRPTSSYIKPSTASPLEVMTVSGPLHQMSSQLLESKE